MDESSEPDIEIIQPDAWESFREIRLKALKTDPIAFGSSYEEESVLREEEWKKKLTSPDVRKTYAARVGGRIVAIAGVRFEHLAKVAHMATLVAVFTDPDFRGRGIAIQLIKKILDDLRADPKIVKVRLSVGVEQIAARRLYEKLGFVQAGVARKEIRIGGTYHDQVQMELLFDEKIRG